MLLLIGFMVGIIVGSLVSILYLRHRTKAIGTLRIDTSDETEPPYLFLELTEKVEDFFDRKEVTLKVNNESYISHE